MTPIWIRPGRPEDKDQFLAWARKNVDKNHFSEAELEQYRFLVAERDGKVLCYLPVKPVLMLESLAPNPDCTSMELASALRELVIAANLQAETNGIRELVFWDTDAGTTRGAQLMGFREVAWKLYRLCR